MPDDDARKIKMGKSLECEDVPNATAVITRICEAEGDHLLGLDLLDEDGNTFAHAHFNFLEAINFYGALVETLAELAQLERRFVIGAGAPGSPEGTRH